MTATDARQQPDASSEAEQAEQRGLSVAASGGAFRDPLQKGSDILWHVYEGIVENRILLIAAGITFYLILALFPGIAALISCTRLSASCIPKRLLRGGGTSSGIF